MTQFNKFKKSFGVSLSIVLLCSLSQAHADGTSASQLCSLPTPTATFSATMANIQTQVLKNNYQIVEEFNKVHDAKLALNKAQDSLIPGISLTGLSTISSNPTFALSAVQILLPFFIPSNWSNLDSAEDAFKAEKVSYFVTELNAYASTLATYFAILGDKRAMDAWQENADSNQQILLIEQQSLAAGLTSAQAVAAAQANYDTSASYAKGAVTVFCKDYAALRAALVLDPPNSTTVTEISFAQSDADEISDTEPGFENTSITELQNQAFKVAPEAEQIKDMIAAASDEKWSGIFGFISSASIGVTSSGSSNSSGSSGTVSNVDFSNARGSITGGFTFGMFPSYEIAKDNIQEIEHQLLDLEAQSNLTIASNVVDLKNAQAQYELDANAENIAINHYNETLQALTHGLSSKQAAYLAKARISTLSLNRIKDQTARDLTLVTLYRAMLSGPFATIQGCQAGAAPKSDKGGIFGWLGGIFGSAPSEQSLITLCAAPNGIAK